MVRVSLSSIGGVGDLVGGAPHVQQRSTEGRPATPQETTSQQVNHHGRNRTESEDRTTAVTEAAVAEECALSPPRRQPLSSPDVLGMQGRSRRQANSLSGMRGSHASSRPTQRDIRPPRSVATAPVPTPPGPIVSASPRHEPRGQRRVKGRTSDLADLLYVIADRERENAALREDVARLMCAHEAALADVAARQATQVELDRERSENSELRLTNEYLQDQAHESLKTLSKVRHDVRRLEQELAEARGEEVEWRGRSKSSSRRSWS